MGRVFEVAACFDKMGACVTCLGKGSAPVPGVAPSKDDREKQRAGTEKQIAETREAGAALENTMARAQQAAADAKLELRKVDRVIVAKLSAEVDRTDSFEDLLAVEPVLSDRDAAKRDYSFEGQRLRAKIVQVHDGDTVRAVFYLWGGVRVQWRARLDGLDAPELHPSRKSEYHDEEAAAGRASRDALAARIFGQVVTLVCGKFDLYGRILATIEDGGTTSVNQWMLDAGHAVAYDGGTKKPFVPPVSPPARGGRGGLRGSPVARARKIPAHAIS